MKIKGQRFLRVSYYMTLYSSRLGRDVSRGPTVRHTRHPLSVTNCHVFTFLQHQPLLLFSAAMAVKCCFISWDQFTAPCLYCLNCFNTDGESGETPTISLLRRMVTGFWLAKRFLRWSSLVAILQAEWGMTSAPYLVSTPPRERKLAPSLIQGGGGTHEGGHMLLCVTWLTVPMVMGFTVTQCSQYSVNSLLYSEICEGGTWIKYCTHRGPSAPLILTLTALWELLGSLRVDSHVGMDHVLWKWEHYRPELQSQIGVRRGDHFIKVHMTFIASIKLNQDKSVLCRHINHSNLTLIKTIWSQPSPALPTGRDKFGPHTQL